jgi:hypothetical protein
LQRSEATLARYNEHPSSLEATSRPTPAPASDLQALVTDLRAAEMRAASAGDDPVSMLARRNA